MDARPYITQQEQLQVSEFLREINKAIAGFTGDSLSVNIELENKRRVLTGKWGCGAFRGDVVLKFII